MTSVSRFDEAAAKWDQNPARVALARAVGEAMIRRVRPEPSWRILDYGAGTGLLTLTLQPHVSRVVALDSSRGMVETLASKLTASGINNVQTRLWDLESRPYPEQGFDLVVSSMTLHHIRDVPLLLKRLTELLKPSGRLAVADLDSEDGSFHGQADDVFHTGFNRRTFSTWLESAGLTEVSVQDAHSFIKPAATGGTRAYNVFLAFGQKAVG